MHLSVGLGNTFQFILLIDGIRVRRTLSSVDQFIGQAFSNGLDVSEGSFAGTGAQQPNSLVDTTEGRYIDGLTTYSTSTTDTGRIFTGARVDDGANKDLQRIFTSQQVNDFEGMFDNTASHKFLAVIATLHHQGAGQTFNNGALSLAETLGGITTSRVR